MCNCIERVNKELEERNLNMEIDVPFTLSKIERVCVQVSKINPKGKKPVRLFASFCPFCGEDYAAEQSVQRTAVIVPPVEQSVNQNESAGQGESSPAAR